MTMTEEKQYKIASHIIQIASFILAISLGVLAFNVYNWNKLEDAKDDLDKIKREYVDIICVIKDFKDFSPEEFDSLGNEVVEEASNAMKVFRKIFIASAILSNKYDDKDERIEGWKIALRNNPDNRLCYYGLGMAYIKAAIEKNKEAENNESCREKERYYLRGAIKNLSNRRIIDVSTAQYHLALAHLMLAKDAHSPTPNDKYLCAYNALEAIKKVDRGKEKSSDIDTNIGIAYCIMHRTVEDTNKKTEYLNKERYYLDPLQDFPELGLIKEHYSDCISPL